MTADDPTGWIRSEIRSSTAYPVESVPEGTLRLDAMESPFDLPADFHRRLGEEMAGIPLNRYPDGSASELKELLGKTLFGLSPDHLFLGNGSDEILQNLFLATPGPILLSEPTFSMYRIIARIAGRPVATVTQSSDLILDTRELLEAVREHRPSLVVLSSPNNPTGREVSEETVDRLCGEFPGAVLVDEAYFPFSGRTVLSLRKSHSRLMVLRTLSKMGLAALRLGILAADPRIVAELDKVRLPYNMNLLTQRAATLVCREFLPVLEGQVRSIVDLREDLRRSLSCIPGVEPLPSSANFLLIRIGGKDPAEVARALAERGILVRDVSRLHPLLAGCLRVTIGTAPENGRFTAALAHILKGTP
jgi:histidinol-phosphate aminotransferase